MYFKRLTLPILSTFLLISCGGGGDASETGLSPSVPPPSVAAPFTATGFRDVATPAASSVLAMTSSNNVLNALGTNSPGSGHVLARGDSVDILRWALRRMNTPHREKPASIESVNARCTYSGTFSVSYDDWDNNEELTAGDSLTLSANDCQFDADDLPLNGSFKLTLTAITLDAFDDIVTAAMAASFSNFGVAGNILNGSVEMKLDNRNESIFARYTNFTSSNGAGAPTIANFTVSVVDAQTSVSGILTVKNNTYTVSTPVALVFGATYPQSGTLRLTDPVGGRIDVISRQSSVLIDLYLPGDAIRDARSITTWANLVSSS